MLLTTGDFTLKTILECTDESIIFCDDAKRQFTKLLIGHVHPDIRHEAALLMRAATSKEIIGIRAGSESENGPESQHEANCLGYAFGREWEFRGIEDPFYIEQRIGDVVHCKRPEGYKGPVK
jgi:hypothetical protein